MAKIMFYFLPIFALFHLTAATHCPDTSHGELYWKSALPNAPMPKSLQALLQPAGTNYAVNILDNLAMTENEDPTDKNPTSFLYTSTGYQILSYFLVNDIHTGKELKIPQLKAKAKTSGATFLPCRVTNSIPFSSNKFSEILKKLSLQPESTTAKIMKQTIEDCEADGLKGEDKFCATSLESLIDSTVSRFGENVNVFTSEVEKETEMEYFSVVEGVKNLGEKNIVCHKTKYPYVVYFCHSLKKTDVYVVPLVGVDGTTATGLAVCHKDTSGWNPKYLMFKRLNVKPGGVGICHFLPVDTVVWVPKE